MDRNWQIGDRAIVNMPPSLHHGKETTILHVGVLGTGKDIGPFVGCEVDIPNETSPSYRLCVFQYKHLRPIYDGSETVSWESMKDIWEPSPVVTI